MPVEIYNGRRITAKSATTHIHGRRYEARVNGVGIGDYDTDPRKLIDRAKAWIDFIDRDPVVDGDRWGAHWYAPGAYALCASGHPVALAGQCRHRTCIREREAGAVS